MLVCTFWEHELFRRATDQPGVVQNLSLDDSVVLISSESASSFVSVVRVEALAGDLNISVTIIRTGSWLHASDSVRPVENVTRCSTDPRVAIESKLNDKTLVLLNKSHLFDHTLDRIRSSNLALANGIADLATDLHSLEVFSEFVASEVNLAFALRRTISRLNQSKRDLVIVVELAEIVEESVEVEAEAHVACHERVLVGQRHRALDQCVGAHRNTLPSRPEYRSHYPLYNCSAQAVGPHHQGA